MTKAYSITNNLEAWDTIPEAPPKLLSLVEVKKAMVQPSSASGAPVDAAKLREAAGYLECDTGYEKWRDYAAAIGAANCPEAREIAHEFSEGRLDRLGRYKDKQPASYTGPEAVDAVLDTMPPKDGGVGVGSISKAAQEAGWPDTLAPRPSAAETFAPYLATLPREPERDTANDASSIQKTGWAFALHDPVADAGLPPITYRDSHRLWPDSPGKTVSQVIAAPKHHKTNWIMAEKFRLMRQTGAKVLMLALEGAYGVRTMRLKALAAHYGVPLADLRGRFQVVEVKSGGMFDMSDPACVIALADFVRAGGWTDVFIDTQHRAAGALDENSATDARLFWNAVEVLRRRGNINVTLAHHTGKDATKGGRGSSADLASVDQQIVLDFDRGTMTVAAKVTARKDGVDGFEVPFKVHQANESSVPILEAITAAEAAALVAAKEVYTAPAVASAMAAMEVVGRARAVTSKVLVHQILFQRGELPHDPELAEKATNNGIRRLQEAVKKDARLQAYGRKDGAGTTARWIWYLPDTNGEAWPNE